ncbi:FAD:protein FMN transferase [Hydrocarboniphaga effusa]|uniref:FAD:protein FMN transferase n=1 Tax=Hydrocarboniphaga effusa TaxID=243629 RepID=UPI00398C0A08
MEPYGYTFRALGGPCTLRIYGRSESACAAAADAVQAEVLRIERKYSRYRDDSVVSRINGLAGSDVGIEVDDETAGLLDYADAAYAQSDGLFDITSGVLRRAWDFRSGRVPEQAQIQELLQLVGWHRVKWDRPRIKLPLPEMQLDFGGFGKEYAADRAAAILRRHGIEHGLVDLSGDLVLVGPHPDGSPWRVGIQHPRDTARAMAVVDLEAGAVAGSGDYERYFEQDGKRYCHILNPMTGWPVGELSAVSVIASQCLVAGTATTIAMLKEKDGKAWLGNLGLPWIAAHRDGTVTGSIDHRSAARMDYRPGESSDAWRAAIKQTMSSR